MILRQCQIDTVQETFWTCLKMVLSLVDGGNSASTVPLRRGETIMPTACGELQDTTVKDVSDLSVSLVTIPWNTRFPLSHRDGPYSSQGFMVLKCTGASPFILHHDHGVSMFWTRGVYMGIIQTHTHISYPDHCC